MKSAPELWAECSRAGALARHLGAFGEIRVTRREPETTVAWEGDVVRGTVRLEPTGWGTRVTLTVETVGTVETVETVETVDTVETAAAGDARALARALDSLGGIAAL